jgi:hypothetical protein
LLLQVVSFLGMAVNSTMPRDKAQDLVTLEEGLETTAPGQKLVGCQGAARGGGVGW